MRQYRVRWHRHSARFSATGECTLATATPKGRFMNRILGGTETSEIRGMFPVDSLRAAFPALKHAEPFVFLDNAAGAQIPQVVFDAVNWHLLECNVQRGGRYPKSEEVDATIARARQSVADLLNARDAREVAFGMNATSFIRLASLAIGQTLR